MIPDQVIDRLRCPQCGETIKPDGDEGAVECPSGHRWPMQRGYLDCSRGVGPRGDHQRGPSPASASSGTTSTTSARGRGVRRRLLPGCGPTRPGREGRPRRRVREGPLHPVPGRAPRCCRRPRRLLGGGGRRPQPVRLPLRPGGASRISATPRSPRPASISSRAWASSITWTIRGPGFERLARLPGPRRPDPPLPLQPSPTCRRSAPRPWPRRPPCARSPCACLTGC